MQLIVLTRALNCSQQMNFSIHVEHLLIKIIDFSEPGTFFTFLFCLAEDESVFDLLYCITFKLMDHQWLDMHASYMDFNVCLTS